MILKIYPCILTKQYKVLAVHQTVVKSNICLVSFAECPPNDLCVSRIRWWLPFGNWAIADRYIGESGRYCEYNYILKNEIKYQYRTILSTIIFYHWCLFIPTFAFWLSHTRYSNYIGWFRDSNMICCKNNDCCTLLNIIRIISYAVINIDWIIIPHSWFRLCNLLTYSRLWKDEIILGFLLQ